MTSEDQAISMTTPTHDHAAMMREHDPHGDHAPAKRRVWNTLTFWIFVGFAIVGIYYLATEHPAHFWGYAPFALLLACPFLHFFGGHGGHGGHGGEEK